MRSGRLRIKRRTMHPLRGACFPGCPHYGYCHCGCGQQTMIARRTDSRIGTVAKRPKVFVTRHHLVRPWSKEGIPITWVQPLLELLRHHHGTYRRAAAALGTSDRQVLGWRRGENPIITPTWAGRIATEVLRIRAERRRALGLSIYENDIPPRPPTTWESERARMNAGQKIRAAQRQGIPHPAPLLGYESQSVAR